MQNSNYRNGYNSGQNRSRISRDGSECRCGETKETRKCRTDDQLDGLPLAMAYIPWQEWENIFDYCKGFEKGTIFADLYKPFVGKMGCMR